MRYTEPRIIRIYESIVAIQSFGLPNVLKFHGVLVDYLPRSILCTIFAYEADE